ncbi:MAG TPA: glycosyltransferase family A protein [Bacteroidia bacterium]|nr:glycosyltransferase family A protein [Bacteroidia bacterium]
MNKISVIIPCYNAEQFINDCINSVLLQTYRNFEIICVNDGSTDDTLLLLNKLKNDFPEIITVLSIPNCGAPAARNTGFRIAKGDFIQFLDSDDIITPDKFEKQIKNFNQDIDVVVSDRIYKNYDLTETLDTFLFDDIQKYPLETSVKKIIITCNPIYRREVVKQLNGYDEQLKAAQDWDFHLRLVLAGCKIKYVKGIFLINRKVNNSISSNWITVSYQAAIVIEKLKSNLLKHPEMNMAIRQYFAQVYLNNSIYTANKNNFDVYITELQFWAEQNYGFINNIIKRTIIHLLGIKQFVKIIRNVRKIRARSKL